MDMTRGILYSELRHLMVQDPATHYWNLSVEFWDWLEENNIYPKEQEFTVENSHNQFGLLFETDEEVMAVKLRWFR